VSGGPPVVAVARAAKTYANGTRALQPVDLDVAAGEFVTLLGPSGCGKTTLLRMVAGLLPPSSGQIRWWGADSVPFRDPARRLAMVFQSPTLMPWARVAANARLPLDLARVARTDADAAARDALAGVGLADVTDRFPRELSGGMQMRVSIARALATAPTLLLMGTLWRTRRLTVLFVTHSIQEAVYLSTRVVVMAARPGRVIADVPIPAPHPRTPSFRGTAQFAALCDELSSIIARASSVGFA